MINPLKLLLPFALVPLSFISCIGTGSEVEGRAAIEGRVIYTDGKPVQDAVVRIRPAEYLALDSSMFKFCYDTTTDDNGKFYFNSVGIDSYTIEINQNRLYGNLINFSVTAADTFPLILMAEKVTRTGILRGRINLPVTDDSLRPLIAIYGVEYLEKSLITQEFCFTGIPSGIYNLYIVPYRGSDLIFELHNVKVYSDSVTDIGVLNFVVQQFFKGCGSWECDSIAVRMMLDSNNLSDIPVRSVITVDPLSERVIGLNLENRNISNLTKNIGSLSNLKILDIRNNSLTSLPHEIGYLNTLEELSADSNKLLSLPYEIGYCNSLRILSLKNNDLNELPRETGRLRLSTLDISYNQMTTFSSEICNMYTLRYLFIDNNGIQTLPQSMVAMNLQNFTCKNNRLCSVPDVVKVWIFHFDKNWVETQLCE